MRSMHMAQIYHRFEDLCEALADAPREEILHRLYESMNICLEWEQIIDDSLDGIFLADGRGIALFANSAYEKISGLSRAEIEGVALKEFIRLQYVNRAGTLMVMETKRPATIESYFYRTGKRALVTCNPILNRAGEISIIVSNVRDLTEIDSLKEQVAKDQALVNRYKGELEVIKKQLYGSKRMVANDPATLKMLHMAKRIAQVDSTILLTGETGVGKEVVAKYIHENSPRNIGNFIKINCGAIAENLFESELFGYERGAFTGAKHEGKIGLFEVADRGTVFLDEIGEMPLHMQAKLLRVLQEKEITRVGGVKPIKVDVRVIAATNRDLKQMVTDKLFRLDLFYRLSVVPIQIPALRDRRGDIRYLAEAFLREMNLEYGEQKAISEESFAAMLDYEWPGNVRELRNMIERSVIMSAGSELRFPELTQSRPIHSHTLAEGGIDAPFDLHERLAWIEYGYMKQAYEQCGNMREAAQLLGMKKSTYAGKLHLYQQQYDQ